MGAPQYEQAGADVSGSGTPGTIPVWNTGTTLTDSPLTVSGTTVTATQAFTVQGTQTFNGNLVSGFNQTWTLNGGFLNIQSGLVYLDKTNSRVGIGTTSPAAPLHVAGNMLCGVGASSNPYQHGLFGASSAYTMWWKTNATAGGGVIGSAGPGLQFYVVSGSPSSPTFLQAAAIDSAGNVGIGTTSPLGPLDVRDTTGGVGIASIYTGAITANTGGRVAFGGYYTGTSPTTWAAIVGGKDNAVAGEYGGHLQFSTRPNGGSITERMRIDSSGNVRAASGTTTMTDGFFYIPAAAGAPTGTPTAIAGRVPMYYDTTNNEFYVYNTAWKKVALL
jgi:hypothetical protein